jgi:hypothetical protein
MTPDVKQELIAGIALSKTAPCSELAAQTDPTSSAAPLR